MSTRRIGENVYRLHGDIPLERVEWFEDPYTLSKLWRWLVYRELRPADPAYFMEHADEYREEYEQYVMWTGNA